MAVSISEGSLDARVLELLDKEEIRELLFRFAEAADTKQWRVWEDCFTEDARVNFPFASHTGREGSGAWAEAALAPFEVTMHLYGNTQLVIEGDEARGKTNFWAACTPSREDIGRHFDEGGSYNWRFRRTDAGWRITSIDLDVIFTSGADETGLSG